MVQKQDYQVNYDYVKYCKDIYSGTVGAKLYLQQFTKENLDKYIQRQNVATLDNYVKRTVQSIKNIIFRKPVDLTEITNTKLLTILETCDLENDINTFAKDITTSVVRDGFTFILVDNARSEEVETRADEIKLGIRPYLVHIDRQDIINWKETNGVFEWVIVKETYSEYSEFEETIKDQYKVFYANRVDIYREDTLYESIETNLGVVPVIKIGSDDVPMLYDQSKINVLHMNKSSELDNYLRIASAPIPITYQLNVEDGALTTIGVNDGINFDAPKNEAGFEWVGLKAENTQAISQRIKELEEAMLNIAISFAVSSKVKTATQVDKESTEDESKLVDVSTTVEQGLNKAISLLALYDNTLSSDKDIYINKDFNSNLLTPEQINTYMTMYQQSIISLDTFWKLLEAGEVLEIGDKEREKVLINDSGLIES